MDTMNGRKKILFISALLTSITFFSCTNIDVRISYNNKAGQNLNDYYLDTIRSDTFNVLFSTGFNNDNVKVLLNNEIIYNQKLQTEPSSGLADEFIFRKQKLNKIKILINGRETKEIKLDNKYNRALLTWKRNENILYFEYSDHKLIFE